MYAMHVHFLQYFFINVLPVDYRNRGPPNVYRGGADPSANTRSLVILLSYTKAIIEVHKYALLEYYL